MSNPEITMQTIREDDSTYTVEVRFINLQSERQAEITMAYVQERICGAQITEDES